MQILSRTALKGNDNQFMFCMLNILQVYICVGIFPGHLNVCTKTVFLLPLSMRRGPYMLFWTSAKFTLIQV